MKKLLKAVAFVTVMCMLLSTAAFANYGEATGNGTTKLITANVAAVGAKEQVVLLIIDHEKTLETAGEDDIMYINQAQALENGTATFENIAIKNTETVVDVYVGSAITGGPKLIGNDIDLSDTKVITLVPNTSVVVYGNEGDDKAGAGVAVTVNVPAGLVINRMIWALDVKLFGAEGEYERVYSPFYEFENGLSGLEGNVQFAAVFNNGSISGENRYEINPTTVGAIFLTSDNDPSEHFTHEADKANKKDN